MTELSSICLTESSGWDTLSGFRMWKQIFCGCLKEREESAKAVQADPSFFLLLGGRKAGKDSIARAFAYDAQQAGYRIYAGSARDILEEIIGLAGTEDMAYLQELSAADRAFVYIRRIDLLPGKKSRRRAFGRFLEKLKALPSHPIVVATACEESRMDECLLDQFQICPVTFPDVRDAAVYYEKRLDGQLLPAQDASYPVLAEETKGYTYGQLHDLTGNILKVIRAERSSEKEDGLPVLTRELFAEVRDTVWTAPQGQTIPTSFAYSGPDAISQLLSALAVPGTADREDSAARQEQTSSRERNASDGLLSGNPLEKLEASDQEMEDAGSMLSEIRDDIGKSAEDYTDEELAEMGYEPAKELPEDEDALSALSADERAALFDI